MDKPLIIIKLGGSIITDKDSSLPKPRIKIINRLAAELSDLYRQDKYQIILVHGAGSFGHPLAKKYSLHKGMESFEQKYSLTLINQQMIELNSLIVSALQVKNLPAIGLPPHCFAQTAQGILNHFDTDIISKYLKENIIPVLFGDGVLDKIQGCSILSGDIIMPYLANKLYATSIIFLTDVDGVFDSNPKDNPKAKLITEINNNNLENVLMGLTSKNIHNVTGEMYGKIMSIKQNLSGKKIYIVNGLTSNILDNTLIGSAPGTAIFFS